MANQTHHYDPKTMGNLNRRFAHDLGWKPKYQQIKLVLGITRLLMEPMEFANAVADWQSQNAPLKTDGLLGPKTWRRMRPFAKIITAPFQMPLPMWLGMNTNIRVEYNVPIIIQMQNPVCWVRCMDMMLAYRNRTITNPNSLIAGYDITNTSIPNPANIIPGMNNVAFAITRVKMREQGFQLVSHQGESPTEKDLIDSLRSKGPLILLHYTKMLRPTAPPDSGHAVIITGIDTVKDICYINDPATGAKDKIFPTDQILHTIEQWNTQQGLSALWYLR